MDDIEMKPIRKKYSSIEKGLMINEYRQSCINRRNIKIIRNSYELYNYISAIYKKDYYELFLSINGYYDNIGAICSFDATDDLLTYFDDIKKREILSQISWSDTDNIEAINKRKEINYETMKDQKLCECKYCGKTICIGDIHYYSRCYTDYFHFECYKEIEIDELSCDIEMI